MRVLTLIMTLAATLLLIDVYGCKEVASDRLYALKLDRPPVESDWERSLPRIVVVRGGRPHRMPSFADVDEDTVHTSTASCHHGARLPKPVEVEMRAFYTDQDLFLRLSWLDETPDRTMRDWVYDGEQWQNSGQLEDGFGLIWDTRGAFPEFSCSYACHIRDFGVDRSSFHASNKMVLADDRTSLDLWNWKAARTGPLGFADDRTITHEGMAGDLPGEIFLANSRIGSEDPSRVVLFGQDDQPVFAADRRPVTERDYRPGSVAPGFIVERPLGSRADITAQSRYESGRWVVTLTRALQTDDDRDVVFVPGDLVGVSFGLALMDHTEYEHYASKSRERLVLLDSITADVVQENVREY